jgi:hypothetical protein
MTAPLSAASAGSRATRRRRSSPLSCAIAGGLLRRASTGHCSRPRRLNLRPGPSRSRLALWSTPRSSYRQARVMPTADGSSTRASRRSMASRRMSGPMPPVLWSRRSRSPRPTSMMGVPVQMPYQMTPERCSPTVLIAARISATRCEPGVEFPVSWPPACGAATKPTRTLVSMPGTSRSIAFAPGSRRSSGPGNAATVCGECDGVASLKPPFRSTSPPSPTISSVPDRSSWQPPDLANPETIPQIKPIMSGLATAKPAPSTPTHAQVSSDSTLQSV